MSLALCSLLEIQPQKTLLFKPSRPGETGKQTVTCDYTVMVLDITVRVLDGWLGVYSSLIAGEEG
ncbi:MAG: hypothetical protein PWK00_00870, partial [Coxiella burnetii]|nr:hypothetical protein [Coxiella burnetii]